MFSTSLRTLEYSPSSSPYTYTSVTDEPLLVTENVTSPASRSVRSRTQPSSDAATATALSVAPAVGVPWPQASSRGDAPTRRQRAWRVDKGGLRSAGLGCWTGLYWGGQAEAVVIDAADAVTGFLVGRRNNANTGTT